ncbi:EboA domain-containing protein [Pontibacter sp. 172403-2]|uniref:EboA domain-containing protein n=1 Tax=Pontibacter rufus TaxID=2791028 RepID=UPI0018B009CD|nr:EboA domain-containing protein [Pontibacter sp. 172403-2]MBF9254492.1 EboA domain-containing protein [Pontibacter sp. 172403-2]
MYQVDIQQIQPFLLRLLHQIAAPEAIDWLSRKLKQVSASSGTGKEFYLAFSSVPRYMGKAPLQLSEADLAEAQRLRKGFNPANWTTDQAARTLLILTLPHTDKAEFLTQINKLFSTADMGELVALYAAMPLLPYPEDFKARAAEGFRTNMGNVYEAVALDNPYPADYLDEAAWNQMVLKTLFVGKPLFRIYGIDRRSNARLAHILSDYAHERWAAGRTVSPELWRPVGPFIDDIIIKDIRRLFDQPEEIQHEAAALACAQSSYPEALELLKAHPQLKNRIDSGELTWDLIGAETLAAQK